MGRYDIVLDTCLIVNSLNGRFS